MTIAKIVISLTGIFALSRNFIYKIPATGNVEKAIKKYLLLAIFKLRGWKAASIRTLNINNKKIIAAAFQRRAFSSSPKKLPSPPSSQSRLGR
jgi:hypothetical protein